VESESISLPEPKSYLSIALLLSFLFGFPVFTFLPIIVVIVLRDHVWTTILLGASIGIAYGLLFGSIVAIFYKGVRINIKFSDKNIFKSWLTHAAMNIDFKCGKEYDNIFIYWMNGKIPVGYGKIYIQVENDHAIIVGPRRFVNKLLIRFENQ
jgi:hypothetical protein